jgi:hypothetical protein
MSQTDIPFGAVLLPTGDWQDLPNTQTPFYIAAQNGYFLHRATMHGRGLIRPKRPPQSLPSLEPTFIWTADPVPSTIYATALAYFRAVYARQRSEAVLLITSNGLGHYRLFCPLQIADAGSVSHIFNPRHIQPGWQIAGTIHSHCEFSAFLSGTDISDASKTDGLHVTIGNITSNQPSLAAAYSIAGTVLHFPPEALPQVFATTPEPATYPGWWLDLCHTDTPPHRPAWATDEDWAHLTGPTFNEFTTTSTSSPFTRFATPDHPNRVQRYLDLLDKLYADEDDIDEPTTRAPHSSDHPSYDTEILIRSITHLANSLRERGVHVYLEIADRRPALPLLREPPGTRPSLPPAPRRNRPPRGGRP